MPVFSAEQRLAIAIGVPTLAFLLFMWYRRRQNVDNFDDDDEQETQTTVATVFETTLEVKIPHRVSGAIIGRGGANIKKIQKDTATYINFVDEEEPRTKDFGDEKAPVERTIVIKGQRENARKAELMIKKIVADQPKVSTEEYFIPQRACGKIIGRGGITIRHLCQVSGARIVIDRTEIRPEIPRKCTITGTADQIVNAKGLLEEKIAEHNAGMARKRVPAVQPLAPMSGPPTMAKGPSMVASSETQSSLPPPVQYPAVQDYVEVFVSAVDNPGHFWVQLVKRQDAQELDRLVSELTDEANTGGADSILESVMVGDMCCAPFHHDDSWYRAQVTKVNRDGTVNLFYVDYGDFGNVPKYRLRKIRDEQLLLPFQAIECYLANVRPKDDSWSEAATERFNCLAHYPEWLVVMSKVVKYCGSIPCLDVYDTTTDKDLYINEEMIKEGFADQDPSHPLPPPEHQPQESGQTQTNEPGDADVTDCGPKDTSAHAQSDMEGNSTDDDTFDVSAPVTPERFSPVKEALVKRVSQDYTRTSGAPSPKSSETSMDGSEEEKIAPKATEESIKPEVSKETESSEELQSLSDSHGTGGTMEQERITEVTQPEVATPEVDTKAKREYSPALKPEVEEMIKLEVSRAFETEVTAPEDVTGGTAMGEEKGPDEKGCIYEESPASADVSASVQKQEEATLQNGAEEEEDDEDLETFTSTYQNKVMSKKTFVSSVTLTTNETTLILVPSEKRENVTGVSRNAAEENLNGGVTEPAHIKGLEQNAARGTDAENSDVLGTKSIHVGHNTTCIEVVPDYGGSQHATAPVTGIYNVRVEPATESPIEKGSSEDTATREEDIAQKDSQIVHSRPEESNSEESDSEGSDEENSGDSDSESFASALDEPASDTDSASYDTARAHISSSTTSLEYASAEGDTDTDTIGSQHGPSGTPVNSDSEEEDEEEDDGDTTPKRKRSIQDYDTEVELTPKGPVTMTTKYGSEQELGYRGDTEASTENLHRS